MLDVLDVSRSVRASDSDSDSAYHLAWQPRMQKLHSCSVPLILTPSLSSSMPVTDAQALYVMCLLRLAVCLYQILTILTPSLSSRMPTTDAQALYGQCA